MVIEKKNKKKVFLRDRKKPAARNVASTQSSVWAGGDSLSWLAEGGTSILTGGGSKGRGTPRLSWGSPSPSKTWDRTLDRTVTGLERGTPAPGKDIRPETGVPLPPRKDLAPETRVPSPPRKDLGPETTGTPPHPCYRIHSSLLFKSSRSSFGLSIQIFLPISLLLFFLHVWKTEVVEVKQPCFRV